MTTCWFRLYNYKIISDRGLKVRSHFYPPRTLKIILCWFEYLEILVKSSKPTIKDSNLPAMYSIPSLVIKSRVTLANAWNIRQAVTFSSIKRYRVSSPSLWEILIGLAKDNGQRTQSWHSVDREEKGRTKKEKKNTHKPGTLTVDHK